MTQPQPEPRPQSKPNVETRLLEFCKDDDLQHFKEMFHHKNVRGYLDQFVIQCIRSGSENILKHLFNTEKMYADVEKIFITSSTITWIKFYIEHYLNPRASMGEKVHFVEMLHQYGTVGSYFREIIGGIDGLHKDFVTIFYGLVSNDSDSTISYSISYNYDDFTLWYLKNVCNHEDIQIFAFKKAVENLSINLASKILGLMDDDTINRNYKSWLIEFAQSDPDMVAWFAGHFDIVKNKEDVLPCLQPCMDHGRIDVYQWLIENFDISLHDQIQIV